VYDKVESSLVGRFNRAVPRLDRMQRDQFAQTLPWLAILSVALSVILGGWLGLVISLFQLAVSGSELLSSLVLAPFFWIALLPPLLWALSFVPLQHRQLPGWRLFVAGTVLSLIGALVSLQLISILFSAAILYVTLQCYEDFGPWYRY
jgi:type III secretory pathway component EscS